MKTVDLTLPEWAQPAADNIFHTAIQASFLRDMEARTHVADSMLGLFSVCRKHEGEENATWVVWKFVAQCIEKCLENLPPDVSRDDGMVVPLLLRGDVASALTDPRPDIWTPAESTLSQMMGAQFRYDFEMSKHLFIEAVQERGITMISLVAAEIAGEVMGGSPVNVIHVG